MSSLSLEFKIHRLDNRMLLPAGTKLPAEYLKSMVRDSSGFSQESYFLMDHGTVKDDTLHLFKQIPYCLIFSDQKRTAMPLNLMARVRLIKPFLDVLDYFHQQDFYTFRHILMVFALSSLLAQDMLNNYEDLMRVN